MSQLAITKLARFELTSFELPSFESLKLPYTAILQLQCSSLNPGSVKSEILLIQTGDYGP